ncbi:HNH endonuclease [Afipia clevelandensis]|jgi:hypothetical protein|uniref:HNH endonuclease 5 domain-containing protein n=2 Tax=Pseudomonadota TaxID=1224 RepID=K8P3E0_9BRAD|nr:hypothetical protein [Afipia clevelandensis]EKS35986.1 hypothetical protein HMPREF9696_02198 [Afipia clevelandensis ATCC 49720]RTL78685.1 MAG: hypothetical protein EKK35_11515 [Bradyrhizobiaceae bacterium]
MAKKPGIGKCVHCLKDHVELTSDHMFPKSWYPDATPDNLEKWQFPCCLECNQQYSKIESDLLNRFALALDAKHPASQGLIETALRAMDPNAGRDEKDAAARTLRCRKILGDMFKGEEIPEDQILSGLGERWGRAKGEQLAVQIPRSGVDKMTEKIVRGLVYREDGRFIETPYEVSTYVDGAEADFAREMIQKAGKEYKREPGLEIRRATVDSDPRTAIYEITFWKQFKTYATVGYDCPPGNHLLDRSEAVTAGDLWCHRGKVHRIWLPAKLFGKQLPNNDYCRKAF